MELATDKLGNPILNQFSEEGFIDCVFCISQLIDTGASYKFHASASYSTQILGFNIEVIKDIKAGFDSDMSLINNHVYSKGVIFSRSGQESDYFLSVLSSLYGLKNNSYTMVDEETYTAIALHQGNIDIDEEPIKIKLFGKDSEFHPESEYYESFFNLDLKNKLLYWNEKDQEYREALINGLSK